MIKAANRVVFLADHTKLKHMATAHIAALADVYTLITDCKASLDLIKELRNHGLKVLVA